MKSLFILLTRILKNETVSDFFIALAWAVFVGLPLFILHMLVVDYEHSLHGMSLQFSLEMSLKNMFPYHPVSIGIWLISVFITAFSFRSAFRKQREVLAMRGQLKRSQLESYTDELTGVLNRRAFDHQFKSSLEYARLENQPLTVVMIDLDKFKSLNDQYGHITGDEALRSVGSYLKGFVRAQDAVARYGGDEFVILCPGLCKEGAISMVNRLRTSIRPLEVELSIGVATYPFDGQSMMEIMEFADKLMYQEKEIHHVRQKSPRLTSE